MMKFSTRNLLLVFPWVACALMVIKSCVDSRRVLRAEMEAAESTANRLRDKAAWDEHWRDADEAAYEMRKARDEHWAEKLRYEELREKLEAKGGEDGT